MDSFLKNKRASGRESDETRRYIAELLRIPECNGNEIFMPEAIEAVHEYARGIPRLINVLCEHALVNAFVGERKPVSREIVKEVARDFGLHPIEQMMQVPLWQPDPRVRSK